MHELIVDNFAGGGGASLGIELALGRSPDIAINHDPEAVAVHAANHPATRHYAQNIWQVDPREVTGGRPVGLAWFSPDCKHFSKAKGGKPVEKRIRDLAWVVVHWARLVKPRIICLENVEEFRDWGPLIEADNGKLVPCPLRKGLTFRRWVRELKKLGYAVEYRDLRACDYGAPTIRKRLFLIARRDGKPIVWPAPTHAKDGAGGLLPWRTAAECLDWTRPCPSIFLTREEGRAIGVNRPLADATMRRIARGVRRYVLEAAQPFIVSYYGDGAGGVDRSAGLGHPLYTQTTENRHALVTPFLAPITHAGDDRVHAPGDPLRTITTARRGEHALAAATLIKQNFGDKPCQGADEPLHTVTTQGNRFNLVAAFLAQHNGGMVGHSAEKPLSTITLRGTQQQLVAAHLLNMKGRARSARGADEPVPTICAERSHAYHVAAFLQKYYGMGGQDAPADEPAHTVTSKGRLGLVTVTIAGEEYAIADIGMRMLSPRELFRAQGFPDRYIIAPLIDGAPITKTAQIRMVGNSVCPPIAAAIVRANVATEEAAAA